MREINHNTPEQVHGYMEQALVILRDLELTDDLAAVALPLIYSSVASKQVFLDQADVSGGVLLAAPNPGNSRLQ